MVPLSPFWLSSTCFVEAPASCVLHVASVLLGGLATPLRTTVIWSGLPLFNLWLTPKETSALWNSYCWEAALKIVLEMGGGVLEQLD